jgi:hypothetical protein
MPEGGQKRERRGQMQHHAAHRGRHAGTQSMRRRI